MTTTAAKAPAWAPPKALLNKTKPSNTAASNAWVATWGPIGEQPSAPCTVPGMLPSSIAATATASSTSAQLPKVWPRLPFHETSGAPSK